MSLNDRLDDIRTAFDENDTSRRDFLRVSAGMGGAVALPGQALRSLAATGQPSELSVTERYQYVFEHTPEGRTIPTLLHLESEDGFDQLEQLDAPVRTTTEPRVAAHADLTAQQVAGILGQGGNESTVPAATKLRYSAGSTPFWMLDHYPNGIFPDPEESIGYIDYEQAVAGLERLQKHNENRLNLVDVGDSPGWYNTLELEVDPKDIHLAAVTNDVHDSESFRKKEKILYSLSIHGDERAGVEAGTRVLEDVLSGDDEMLSGMLDDVVLLFLYPNPDGWVAPSPTYFSGDQVEDDDLVRIDAFRRYTGKLLDMNRQWPNPGYIDPTHNPAEPDGADLKDDMKGVDDDVPERYTDLVPGALDIVEHLRGYENLNYGTDLHGMFDSDEYILGLIMNTEYDVRELHDLYELNNVLGANLDDSVGPLLEENRETFEELAAEMEEWYASFGVEDFEAQIPTEPFSYGTVFDTIDYTTTGTFGSWFAQPEELGGLGLVSMSPEMSFDNRIGERMEFRPQNVETQVAGYRTFIETFAQRATTRIEAEIDTNGRSTAYVTTDALTRSSDDLPFTGDGNGDSSDGNGSGESLSTSETTVSVGGGQSSAVAQRVDGATGSLHVGLDGGAALVGASLRAPDGSEVRSHDPASATQGSRAVWTVTEPRSGEWTIELANGGRETASIGVSTATMDGGEAPPDPEEVLGYEQREYEVTPFQFFEQYAEYADGTVDALTVDDVAGGALEGSDGPAYDNVVVVHDETTDGYASALDSYVENGGNLVLTDGGVRHLGALSAAGADGIDSDAVSDETFVVGHLGEKRDHPLLSDVRPIQRELYKVAPLGYPIGDAAPMTLVGTSAFESAGGEVAATTGEMVSLGALGDLEQGIQVVGGVLPPASQQYLHPFGLHDYAVSFLGQTVLANALGHTQRRIEDGEVIATFGRGEGKNGDGGNGNGDGNGDGDDDCGCADDDG